jgi:signal recognition particle receptor subunit beta
LQLDFAARELTIKLVYYGPALSGKTTNLQSLHRMADKGSSGRLMTLETRDDRTLFFDLLPLTFRGESDIAVRLKLFTVPGQVIHGSTRRLVLQGADGVVFVADSQLAETQHNNESFANLKVNLKENRLDQEKIPIVIQFNKRDLPRIRSDEDIRRISDKGQEPIFVASAIHGQGVVETFLGAAAATCDALERRIGLTSRHGVRKEEVLSALGAQLNYRAPAPSRGVGAP